MANDNIQVEVLDSSSEFRPGRKGGSVNWMQLLSGVLMLVFGLVCVFCPFEVLMGISAIIAVCVIVAGGIALLRMCAIATRCFRKAYGACSSAP